MYYSSPNLLSPKGHATGDADNDNARVITENRIILAEAGDESWTCGDTSAECLIDDDCTDPNKPTCSWSSGGGSCVGKHWLMLVLFQAVPNCSSRKICYSVL